MTDKAKTVGEALIAPTPEVPALKIIGEVRTLNVQSPADVIVINVNFPISQSQVQQVIEQWKEASMLPNPVVVLIEGVEVHAVKPGVKV